MIIFTLILNLLILPRPAFALTVPTLPPVVPTVITTPSPVPTNIDEIQKIREVVQQKVQEKLKQITEPGTSKKGVIGKVIQLSPSQLTIELAGNTKSIKLDSTTVYVDLNRNKTKIDNLKIGQDILVLGISDSQTNSFLAKRIVFIDLATVINPPSVVVGKIVDISKTSSIFTLIPSRNKNSLYQIKPSTKTEIVDKNGKMLALSSLISGEKIIAILLPDPKLSKTYLASKIVIVDQIIPSPTPTKAK